MVNTLCSRMYSVGSNPAEHMFYWVALTFHPLSPIFAGHSSNNSKASNSSKQTSRAFFLPRQPLLTQAKLPTHAMPGRRGPVAPPKFPYFFPFFPIFPHFPPFFPIFPHFSPFFLAMGTLWVRLRVHYPPPEPGTSEPCLRACVGVCAQVYVCVCVCARMCVYL